MGRVVEIDDGLWAGLSTAARGRGRTPAGIVRGLIREFVEAGWDLELDAAIGKEVRRSGHREVDAVRLVREYRRQVHARRPARAREASS